MTMLQDDISCRFQYPLTEGLPVGEARSVCYGLPARDLADTAVHSLLEEVDLTPKPGLVDRRGSGAHSDMSLELMHRSAWSLHECFRRMAEASAEGDPLPRLRERLGAIGRDGENAMFAATSGCNTHKGAIWALGLLIAGTVRCGLRRDPARIAAVAGALARCPDPHVSGGETNGIRACRQYGAGGARGQARANFPHVIEVGLPRLRSGRRHGLSETCARLDALMAIMSCLDDTCVLHRGGQSALDEVQHGAGAVLRVGGTGTAVGRRALAELDRRMLELHVSPGGSGDLIAATLFVDMVTTH